MNEGITSKLHTGEMGDIFIHKSNYYLIIDTDLSCVEYYTVWCFNTASQVDMRVDTLILFTDILDVAEGM